MSQVKVKVLSWSDVYDCISVLADKILGSGWIPDVIIAIARGGLVPAMLLSDFLGVKSILTMQLEHWPAPGQVEATVRLKFDIPPVDLSGKRVLIVDDIADTGDTLLFAKSHIEAKYSNVSIRTAAMHVRKNRAKFLPDYWSVEVESDHWIMYPWNYVEDLTSIMERISGDITDSRKLIEILQLLQSQAEVDLSKIPVICMRYVLRNLHRNRH